MASRGPTEDSTCRRLVRPALLAAGWSEEQVVEQRYVTDGRIVPTAKGHRRREGRRVDYLLEIRPGFPVGVVEAKRLFKLPGDGLQQAMRYAEMLGLGFAYSTNGKGIVEHDYDTGAQRTLAGFPSPFATTRPTSSTSSSWTNAIAAAHATSPRGG